MSIEPPDLAQAKPRLVVRSIALASQLGRLGLRLIVEGLGFRV